VTVLFDTSTLLLALDPGAKPPLDPATNQPLEHARRRVEYLIRTLSKAKAKVQRNRGMRTLSELWQSYEHRRSNQTTANRAGVEPGAPD